MSFVEHEITHPRKVSERPDVSACIMKGGKNSVVVQLTVSPACVDREGWQDGKKFKLLVGRAENHGLLRLEIASEPAIGENFAVLQKTTNGKNLSYKIKLGVMACFVQEVRPNDHCSFEKIGEGLYEIALPKWADETKPKPKTRILSPDSPLSSVESEADVRRRERAKIEEMQERKRQGIQAKQTCKKRFRRTFKFTKMEKEFLSALVEKAPNLARKDHIYMCLYSATPESGDAPDPKVIDLHLMNVRKKLKNGADTDCKIETVFGEGFKLTGDPDTLYERITQ